MDSVAEESSLSTILGSTSTSVVFFRWAKGRRLGKKVFWDVFFLGGKKSFGMFFLGGKECFFHV